MGKFSLGYQVLTAVLLGILVGLFFGPLANALQPIGDAYTMLLQMAVLPYICLSLIHGLGSITPTTGKKLFKSGWPFLLILWVLIFTIIFLLSYLIPSTTSPLIDAQGIKEFESSFTTSFLSNLIPQNPLYDIANNIVPAVAVFGLIGGLALMHVEKKEPLISALERINQTIEKVLKWLGILSPIGAFAYVSIAFGTIYLEDLYKIEIYVIAFILISLFITFFVLPTLLSTLTSMTYKESIRAFRYVCLLPFVTGLGPAALPFLNNYLKHLSKKHETHEKFRETSQTFLPIAYSFGNIGNAMVLFFIFFLSYYYRHPFSNFETILLSILTVPLSIGSSASNYNSIQFLIQQLGFPQGAFNFFLQIKSFTYNFQVMMSTASVLTLIILAIYAYYGLLQFKWKPLVYRLGASFFGLALLIFSFKSLVHFEDVYKDLYPNLRLSEVVAAPSRVKVLSSGQTGAPRTFSEALLPDILKQILSTRTLKVGFNADSIPFCYYNNQQELVGYDIAFAYELARDLDCELELIPFNFNDIATPLNRGDFDIGMSSIIMSEDRLLQMDFTFPYYEDYNVLIVPFSKKSQFLHLSEVQQRQGLRVGAGGEQFYIGKRHFPRAEMVDIADMADLVEGKAEVILNSQTSSVIWCLAHPSYVCMDYGNRLGRNYFAYPIRQHATNFGFFLNNWLSLKEQSGFKKKMHAYWIDGNNPSSRPPRWSILHNILWAERSPTRAPREKNARQ